MSIVEECARNDAELVAADALYKMMTSRDSSLRRSYVMGVRRMWYQAWAAELAADSTFSTALGQLFTCVGVSEHDTNPATNCPAPGWTESYVDRYIQCMVLFAAIAREPEVKQALCPDDKPSLVVRDAFSAWQRHDLMPWVDSVIMGQSLDVFPCVARLIGAYWSWLPPCVSVPVPGHVPQ